MRIFFIFSLTMVIATAGLFACDITMTTDKTEYKKGDTAVITVTVNQTHGVCGRKDVKPLLTAQGATVTAQTSYKEIKPNIFEIKFKITVNDEKATVTAEKPCPKGGEKTTLALTVKK